MSDEAIFNKYLRAAGTFTVIKDWGFRIANPRVPKAIIEIDNLALKGDGLFIFEGKRGKPDISQLKERFFLFEQNKFLAAKTGILPPYVVVRVFYYSLKKQRIIEFTRKGEVANTFSYATTLELISFLQKI